MLGTINIIIETEFLREKVISLTKLGCTHSSKGKQSVWSFTVDKIPLVEAILETRIELNPEPITELQNRYGIKEVPPEPPKEVPILLPAPEKKRSLELKEVIVKGEIQYVFYDSHKDGRLTKRHEVSKSIVDNLKEIIKNTDAEWFKDSRIPVKVIQERMVKRYGMTQFSDIEGKFNQATFFGNREYYFHYFYFPLKVLVNKGLVIHHKRGFISKVQKTKIRNKTEGTNVATG